MTSRSNDDQPQPDGAIHRSAIDDEDADVEGHRATSTRNRANNSRNRANSSRNAIPGGTLDPDGSYRMVVDTDDADVEGHRF